MDTKSFYDIIWRGLTSPLAKTGGGPLDINVEAYPYPSDYYVGEGPGPFGPPRYAAGVAQNAPLSIPPRPPAIAPMGRMGGPQLPSPQLAAGTPAGMRAAPPPPGAPMSAGTPQALPGIPSGILLDLAKLGQPGAQNAPEGFLGFLSRPDISSALMQAGLGMLQASMPSTNPASGSLGAVLGGGLGGFNSGMEAAREAKRQAREDAINEAYKLAIMQGDPNKAPSVVKDGAGNSYVWNAEAGQYEPFGTGKATGGGASTGGTAGTAAKALEGFGLPATLVKEASGLIANARTADFTAGKIEGLLPLIQSGQIPQGRLQMMAYEAWKAAPETASDEMRPKFENFARLERELFGARNAILMAAKGVQTEGDAQRALDQIANATNDPAALARAMQDLVGSLRYGSDTYKAQVEFIFANEGKAVPDNIYGTPAKSDAAPSTIDDLPDPGAYDEGTIIEDDTGRSFRLSGGQWVAQ